MTTLVTTLTDQTILTLDGPAEDGYAAALTIWNAVAGAAGVHCDGLRVWVCDERGGASPQETQRGEAPPSSEVWSLFCEINYCTHER